MDLITGIKERRSIRAFQDRPIPRQLIREAVEAASYAPSWKNTQTARYLAVDDRNVIGALASDACTMGFSYNSDTIRRAPALILLTSVTGRSGYERDGSFSTAKEDRWEVFDAGIAAQTFCLAAHALGLGTVILGIFDEAAVRAVVPIPETERLAALIAIGYPARVPEAPRRRPPEELLAFYPAGDRAPSPFG